MTNQDSLLRNARRIVVKVGSALVTNDGRGLDVRAIERWAGQIAALRAMGREVLLVSSGAIAEGVLRIGWETRPTRALSTSEICSGTGVVTSTSSCLLSTSKTEFIQPIRSPHSAFGIVGIVGNILFI